MEFQTWFILTPCDTHVPSNQGCCCLKNRSNGLTWNIPELLGRFRLTIGPIAQHWRNQMPLDFGGREGSLRAPVASTTHSFCEPWLRKSMPILNFEYKNFYHQDQDFPLTPQECIHMRGFHGLFHPAMVASAVLRDSDTTLPLTEWWEPMTTCQGSWRWIVGRALANLPTII